MTDREALTWLQAMLLGRDMGSAYNVQRTQEASEALSSALNNLQDLHTRYTQSLRTNTTLANNNAELSMNCKALSKELREAGSTCQKWAEAFVLQYEDNVRQRAITRQRGELIEELENELDELSMLLDSRNTFEASVFASNMRAKNDELESEVRRLTEFNARLASEVERLASVSEMRSALIDALHGKVDNLQAENAVLQTSLSSAVSDMHYFRSRAQEVTNELRKLRLDVCGAQSLRKSWSEYNYS